MSPRFASLPNDVLRDTLASQAAFPDRQSLGDDVISSGVDRYGYLSSYHSMTFGTHPGHGLSDSLTGVQVHIIGLTHAEFGPWGLRREFTIRDEVSIWTQSLLACPDQQYA